MRHLGRPKPRLSTAPVSLTNTLDEYNDGDAGSLPHESVSQHAIQPASDRSKGCELHTLIPSMAVAKVASIHASVAAGKTVVHKFAGVHLSLQALCRHRQGCPQLARTRVK